jgi:hypothetical protein
LKGVSTRCTKNPKSQRKTNRKIEGKKRLKTNRPGTIKKPEFSRKAQNHKNRETHPHKLI